MRCKRCKYASREIGQGGMIYEVCSKPGISDYISYDKGGCIKGKKYCISSYYWKRKMIILWRKIASWIIPFEKKKKSIRRRKTSFANKIKQKMKKPEICQYCKEDPMPLTEEKAYTWDTETEKIVFTKNGAAIETGDARRIPIDFCPKCGRCLRNLIGEED